MSATNSPGFSKLEAERCAEQLNEGYVVGAPYEARYSAIEGAWYVAGVCGGKVVTRTYRRPDRRPE